MPDKPCTKKIKVMRNRHIEVLDCCLFAPHKGIKHYNPRLLLTLGGERVTKDVKGKDIIKTWGFRVEHVKEP